jgi:ketosteroid isomerase-like protein
MLFIRCDVRAEELTMTCLSFFRSSARAAVLFATLAVTAIGSVAAPQAVDGSADKGPTLSRCSTFVEERNRANFEAYLAALTSGDFAKALGYFAPGAVVVAYGSVPFAGTYSATDGAWAALQQQYWDFSAGAAQEAPVLYADCNKVILNGSFKRVARATGRTVDSRVIEYFTFDAQGKMVRDDFYLADTAAVNAALGVP